MKDNIKYKFKIPYTIMRDIIEFKLNEIGDSIFSWSEKDIYKHSLGLYNGDFGTLLFMFHYSNFSKKKIHKKLTIKYCEDLLKRIGDVPVLHTFCSGLSGILYLFEFLKENNFIDIDISEAENYLQNLLIDEMRKDIQNCNYDFMHGAIGVGLYFLKANKKSEVIQEIVDFLIKTSEIDTNSDGVKWKSKIEEGIHGYNISLSHGMSSIVLFLCRVIEKGLGNSEIEKLLRKSIKYILGQKINEKQYGSYFPIFSKESSSPLSSSRLAWCYGDLGIAYAIFQAGAILSENSWKDKGLKILLHTTTRRDSVYEPGICHGCMSMVMIYNKMFSITKIQTFAEGANYWLHESLKFSNFKDGPAGYKSIYDNKWINDYSLLSGVAGIGLCYLSSLNRQYGSWSEMLLL